jgi:hypothetical protein
MAALEHQVHANERRIARLELRVEIAELRLGIANGVSGDSQGGARAD